MYKTRSVKRCILAYCGGGGHEDDKRELSPGEDGLLVEIGAGQRDIGREQQLVWRMWLGSIKELHPGRGRYKSMLASRREL